MKPVFADTYYYLALLNPRDAGHAAARHAGDRLGGALVTTGWVLAEVGDALAKPPDRPKFVALVQAHAGDPDVTVVSATDELFDQGVELFGNRPDKSWSLTDCISFVVMRDLGIDEALTADDDFEQAGFTALLKS